MKQITLLFLLTLLSMQGLFAQAIDPREMEILLPEVERIKSQELEIFETLLLKLQNDESFKTEIEQEMIQTQIRPYPDNRRRIANLLTEISENLKNLNQERIHTGPYRETEVADPYLAVLRKYAQIFAILKTDPGLALDAELRQFTPRFYEYQTPWLHLADLYSPFFIIPGFTYLVMTGLTNLSSHNGTQLILTFFSGVTLFAIHTFNYFYVKKLVREHATRLNLSGDQIDTLSLQKLIFRDLYDRGRLREYGWRLKLANLSSIMAMPVNFFLIMFRNIRESILDNPNKPLETQNNMVKDFVEVVDKLHGEAPPILRPLKRLQRDLQIRSFQRGFESLVESCKK